MLHMPIRRPRISSIQLLPKRGPPCLTTNFCATIARNSSTRFFHSPTTKRAKSCVRTAAARTLSSAGPPSPLSRRTRAPEASAQGVRVWVSTPALARQAQRRMELSRFALRILTLTTLSRSVEERNDDQHHRRVPTQSCTSRGILLPAHLRDRGRGELWYQRAPDGRRQSSADCPQHLGARAALPYRDRQQPGL